MTELHNICMRTHRYTGTDSHLYRGTHPHTPLYAYICDQRGKKNSVYIYDIVISHQLKLKITVKDWMKKKKKCLQYINQFGY